MLIASDVMKAYAKANNYVSQGILGYLDSAATGESWMQTEQFQTESVQASPWPGEDALL